MGFSTGVFLVSAGYQSQLNKFPIFTKTIFEQLYRALPVLSPILERSTMPCFAVIFPRELGHRNSSKPRLH